MDQPEPHSEDYLRLTAGCGYVDVSDRALIEVAGEDRATFLHNMCTNEIKGLAAGAGTEAFLTSAQGKTLAYFYALNLGERMLLETATGQGAAIVSHLDRYIIREKVELRELSYDKVMVSGEQAPDVLTRVLGEPPPETSLACAEVDRDGSAVIIARLPLSTWPAYLLAGAADCVANLKTALESAACRKCSSDAWETLRIQGRSAGVMGVISTKAICPRKSTEMIKRSVL